MPGFPEATYSWTKDGRLLAQNRPVITITSVALSDNGRYNCTPTNVRGTGASAVVDVHVYGELVCVSLVIVGCGACWPNSLWFMVCARTCGL